MVNGLLFRESWLARGTERQRPFSESSSPQTRSRSRLRWRLIIGRLRRLPEGRLRLLYLVAMEGLSKCFQIFLSEFSLFAFVCLPDFWDDSHRGNSASEPQDDGDCGEDRTVVQQQIHGLRKEGCPRQLIAVWEILIGLYVDHDGLPGKFSSAQRNESKPMEMGIAISSRGSSGTNVVAIADSSSAIPASVDADISRQFCVCVTF